MSLKEDEKKVDAEFEKMVKKPYIYHFTGEDAKPFRAITIALPERHGVEKVHGILLDVIDRSAYRAHNRASFVLSKFQGIAICDPRDNFDRRKGRVIAKGRLLKHLTSGRSR